MQKIKRYFRNELAFNYLTILQFLQVYIRQINTRFKLKYFHINMEHMVKELVDSISVQGLFAVRNILIDF